jgi:two-component system chemotaxis sensor kinase CheA
VDELIQEFLVESNENLDRFEGDLVKLEEAPGSKELLSSIFRSIHSIKGACGFLGFQKLEKLAHAGENLLSKLRDGQLVLTAEIGSALLESGDGIRQMLTAIGATGTDGEEEFSELIERLKRVQGEECGVPLQAAGEGPANPDEKLLIKLDSAKAPARDSTEETKTAMRPQPSETSEPSAEIRKQSEQAEIAKSGTASEPTKARESSDLSAPADEAPRSQEDGRGKAVAQDSTIRVNVLVLDRLMTLVGELVLARNQLLQFANSVTDTALHAVSQHMNLIATELQEEVMKTRMQPIGNIWGKFPRTVRDLVVSCGKEVRIQMEGKETELDKTIIEAIKDPLTHLVRNAVDHGIELPEVRKAAGKDPVGTLTLRAYHEGGQVNIEISDDGAGLNVDRIAKKAVERGLISAEQAARMQDRDIFNLVFLPGFSTAEKITNVSGRGVGMDVVRTNIERIGGTVDLQSVMGRGSTVRLKIPLTLAIIPALVVTCRGNRFAIPQVALTELVSLDAGDTKGGIETVHGAPVYRLRGRLLPLLYLSRELKLAEEDPAQKRSGVVNIVVLRADDRQFGLVVDEINDTEEIVVKPLRKQLKNLKTLAGASIMGDGRVALILDVLGLAQRANLVSETRENAAKLEGATAAQHEGVNRQTLLLFQPGRAGRMAIPLSSVARLEEFNSGLVERAGHQEVVQYRGQILPLIRVSEAVHLDSGGMPSETDGENKPLQVVVYTDQNRSVGLVVERILDIVEETLVVEQPGRREGLLGSAVVQQRVTDLLDVPGVVRAVYPDFFEAKAGA